MDFTKFFTNPLTRANLPTFGYDVPRDADLSKKYGSAVADEGSYKYYEGGPTNYWPIDCSIEPTSDLPDYTLNGILPGNTLANNVAGFNGILPMISGKLLSENPGMEDDNLTTDGTFIYAVDQAVIWKINPVDGAVIKHATGSGINNLMWYQGSFYSVGGNPATISEVTIKDDETYSVVTTPILVSPTAGWPSRFAVSGADIYYALWQNNSSVIYKLSSLTPDATPTKVFETSEGIESLSASANFLYINGDKYDRAAPAAVLASYPGDLDDMILVGGYFYDVDDGKVVKYAGTPAGGAAKSLGSLF